MRWMVGDVPGRVDLEVKRAEGASGLVTMRVTVRGKEFEPEPETEVRLVVERPGGAEPVTIDAVADDGDKPKLFLTNFRAEGGGGFRVRAKTKNYKKKILKTTKTK